MIFFFPYNTDAPIYHFPFMTIALIVVNTIVYGLQLAYPESFEPLLLQCGNGLYPVQWLTSNFMHGSVFHLVGNMLFLWAFGIIIEGKMGPWKMLALYCGIGILFGAVLQVLMLGAEESRGLGASAVIFGFMAMCLIWSPENEMNCILIFFALFLRVVYFDVPIKILVCIFLSLQGLGIWLTGGVHSSELAHALGAVIGLVVGIVMLKKNWVDCEYWDIFSVWAGRHQMTPEERKKEEEEKPEVRQRKAEESQKHRELLRGEIHRALQEKSVVPAVKLYERFKSDYADAVLTEPDLLNYIALLPVKTHEKQAVTAMREYLVHYTSKTALVKMRLAKLYCDTNRNQTALKVLNEIDPATLDRRQVPLYQQLRKIAETITETDTYALAEG